MVLNSWGPEKEFVGRSKGRLFLCKSQQKYSILYSYEEAVILSDTEVTKLQEQVKTLFTNMGEIKADVKELKEQFANRLPIWATALIALLTATCGWFAGH